MLLGLVSKWVRPALAFSAAAICGCPSGSDDAAGARSPQLVPAPAGSGFASPALGTRELELLSDIRLQLGFNDGATLRVQLLDQDGEPIAGGHVGFALVGRSQDSSLASVDVVTDADGVAENELSSGMLTATFNVRVSAPGAYELFVDVGVSDAGFGTLEVQADYRGPRTVLQRLIFAQAAMSCDEATRMPGDPMVTLGPGETIAQFVALPADVDYAILAFAEGKDGTVVATGCTDGVAVESDERIMASVAFADEPLLPATSFVLQADLDAAAPAVTLGGTLRAAAETLVNTDGNGELVPERAQARFLLDSLDSTLRSEDYAQQPAAIALAAALAQERAAPSGAESPEQSLHSLLVIKDEGALTAVPRLVQLTIEDLGQLRLFAELDVARDGSELPISWRFERIEALPAQNDRAPVAIDLSASEPVETLANLDAAQDALELASVRFGLPFGALAAQVLREVVSFDAAGHGAEIRVLVGCTALSEWLEAQSYTQGGACDASCAQATCDRAVARLVSAAESALAALDEARPRLVLSGELELGDDDGDLIAEHMSTEMLTGEWEPEAGRETGDVVFGPATASTLKPTPPQQ